MKLETKTVEVKAHTLSDLTDGEMCLLHWLSAHTTAGLTQAGKEAIIRLYTKLGGYMVSYPSDSENAFR